MLDNTQATNELNETPLHLAAREGNLKLVKQLAENKAKIDAIDKQGYSPLNRAIVANQIEVVKFLCKLGADVSKSLSLAMSLKHTQIEKIIRYHIDMHRYSTLHYAVLETSLERVKKAINKGGVIDALCYPSVSSAKTALSMALESNYSENSQLFKKRVLVARELIKAGANINLCGNQLSKALINGFFELVPDFINAGARVNPESDCVSSTILHDAFQNLLKEIDTATFKILLDAASKEPGGARVVNIQTYDYSGHTPLHSLLNRCSNSQSTAEKAQLLIEYGADVNIKNKFGQTALDTAKGYKQTLCVKIIEDHIAKKKSANSAEDHVVLRTLVDFRTLAKPENYNTIGK